MTTIAVIGATGFAGGHITAEALARGYDVIAVARDTDGLTPGEHLTLRPGDLFDALFVEALARDADVVVLAVPGREIRGRKAVDAVPALTDAVVEYRRRLGVVSGAASLQVSADGPRLIDTPDFPDEYRPEALGTWAVLDELERTLENVNWFAVSPSAVFGRDQDVPARGTYRLGGDVLLTEPDGNSSIAGADFATAFVDEIASPTHYRERFTVGY
ncbi:NAD(P)H-binding protein [Rhodococcus triatomae]|uniref:NAD(P)-binding domain-containing protein n=1 Tax=Rhodococcus triatomae TaxID=300028 RepID=A0A1G8PLY7_9NOCA|nr:NAD(P)H-binding protein [Rhodococcus triatomae]QNG20146.1 NAD(P)H-binding protein [Rhodococcus triatomae]QNG23938.1 NAD(P)H-binding protein [Rhodococcus triatomae]SDI93589.1 hypothetical protein SAMN05444695_11379 [Rhodococcus triatomae]